MAEGVSNQRVRKVIAATAIAGSNAALDFSAAVTVSREERAGESFGPPAVVEAVMLISRTRTGTQNDMLEKRKWFGTKTQEFLKLQTTSKIVNLCVASHVGSVTVAAETGGFARLPWQQQALLLNLFLEQLLLNPLSFAAGIGVGACIDAAAVDGELVMGQEDWHLSDKEMGVQHPPCSAA
ncbi:unnamed protein product [Sphagnum jensenii]|uniref:Uncharacterized protein n=1 Tax=Sphagnum jensenii TaxID=128206 RepID=A0ABP0XAR1_9BRYO